MTLLMLIQSQHNLTPYHKFSLVSPEVILNPRARCCDLVIPGENQNLPVFEQMRLLAEKFQELRLENLVTMDELQRGNQPTNEPKKGQVFWWLKNDNVPNKGIF